MRSTMNPHTRWRNILLLALKGTNTLFFSLSTLWMCYRFKKKKTLIKITNDFIQSPRNTMLEKLICKDIVCLYKWVNVYSSRWVWRKPYNLIYLKTVYSDSFFFKQNNEGLGGPRFFSVIKIHTQSSTNLALSLLQHGQWNPELSFLCKISQEYKSITSQTQNKLSIADCNKDWEELESEEALRNETSH